MRSLALAGAIAIGVVLAGCSLVLDTDGEQCGDYGDCDPGQSCVDGACRDGCVENCTNAGVSECREQVIYECGQAGGCLRWLAGTNCADSGQQCEDFDGYARCGEGPCGNLCSDTQDGDKKCDGQYLDQCRYTDNDCWEWDLLEDCDQVSQGGSCRDVNGTPQCVPPCTEPCTESEIRCNGFVVETCTLQQNGCREWVPSVVCAGDEYCQAKACQTVWTPVDNGDLTFQMGSAGPPANEAPEHQVTLSAFEMTKFEVTVRWYQACIDNGPCTPTDNHDSLCNLGAGEDRMDHPVNCVTWEQARTFCEWAGGHLPSEAEWEYAARSSGVPLEFPWGSASADCNYAVMFDKAAGCGSGGTMPVGSKPSGATSDGLLDMAGNVEEWVQDYYHSSYNADGGAPTDGSAWDDPATSYRVVRGGGYLSTANSGGLRTRARNFYLPTTDSPPVGFRCAR